MINVAIIGYGRIAQNHIAAIGKIEDAKIVAVCDHTQKNVDRAVEALGCSGYTDVDRMLDEQRIDAAIVCTPTMVHEEYVVACARHGVAVLCEKPLTRTSGACKRVIEAVKAADIIFMTAQVIRFWPEYGKIKELYENGEFGDIYMIRPRRVTSVEDAKAEWLNAPKQGGGALHDMIVHDVDYLRYLAGPFDKCYANAVKDKNGSYNNIMANMIFKNGIHAISEGSFTMQTGYPFSFCFSLNGSKATLEYEYHAGVTINDTDDANGKLQIWRSGKGREIIEVPQEDSFYLQMKYFLDCVRSGKKPTFITPDETDDVIRLIDALHESARTGDVITVDDITPFDFKH